MAGLAFSRSVADDRTAIHYLPRTAGGERVGAVILAKWLGISAAFVASIAKKLAEAGYAMRGPYQGVALTVRGEKVGGREHAPGEMVAGTVPVATGGSAGNRQVGRCRGDERGGEGGGDRG